MRAFLLAIVAVLAGGDLSGSAATADVPEAAPALAATYWIYVLAESPDYIHRVRFTPGEGVELDATIPVAALYRQSGVADLLTDHEDPHGVQVDPSGRHLFVTTGHGLPDGKMWKLDAESGELLADPVILGPFPASMDVSPDGTHAFAVNFNLHGARAPSSVAAVLTSEMMEVADIPTCTMPHGSRFHPTGAFHYSTCMMDDQLVEIDAREYEVSRRFFLGQDEEGPLDPSDRGFHADAGGRLPHESAYSPTCSPTWVQPSHSGEHVYVACNAGDEVLELSFDDWSLARRFPTGRGPYNIDLTSDDGILIATLKQDAGVEFIDLESGESVRVDTSTRVVHGVAVSPDDRYAFVSVEGVGAEPGKVDVFDLETFERVGSVEVGPMASGIAFWKMEP